MLMWVLKDFNKFIQQIFKLDKIWYKIVLIQAKFHWKLYFKLSCIYVAAVKSHEYITCNFHGIFCIYGKFNFFN